MTDEEKKQGFEDWKKANLEVGNVIGTQEGDFMISYSEDEFIQHRYYSLIRFTDKRSDLTDIFDMGISTYTLDETGREYGSVEKIDDLYWLFIDRFDCIPHLRKFKDIAEYEWEH